MQIRRAEEKDIGRISELLYQVNQVHADGRPDLFKPGMKKYSEGELLEIIQEDDTPVYVAVDEDQLVLGYAFCVKQETKGSGNCYDMTTLYIDDICVDEKYRKHHVGTALYQHVRKEAKAMGCYHMTLNVWELNPTARAFYEAMGMVPLKTMMETIL